MYLGTWCHIKDGNKKVSSIISVSGGMSHRVEDTEVSRRSRFGRKIKRNSVFGQSDFYVVMEVFSRGLGIIRMQMVFTSL